MALQTMPTEQYFARVRQTMQTTGQAYVRVTGMSMAPLLRHIRDGVVIVPPDEIRVGDIVLFDRRNGRYALHRVIVKGRKHFIMAGDNQWHFEHGLPLDQVIGVVRQLHRKGRFIPVQNFFIKTYGWAVTLLTFPRIYGYKALRFLVRPLLVLRNRRRKGAAS